MPKCNECPRCKNTITIREELEIIDDMVVQVTFLCEKCDQYFYAIYQLMMVQENEY